MNPRRKRSRVNLRKCLICHGTSDKYCNRCWSRFCDDCYNTHDCTTADFMLPRATTDNARETKLFLGMLFHCIYFNQQKHAHARTHAPSPHTESKCAKFV